MKKLAIIAIIGITAYFVFNLAIEGTRFDNPKIFHIEDKDATYEIIADNKSGYYLLYGTNSAQGGKNFYIPIATAPGRLSMLVGKKVKITGKTGWAEAAKMPCHKDPEKWCSSGQGNPMAVFIEKADVVK